MKLSSIIKIAFGLLILTAAVIIPQENVEKAPVKQQMKPALLVIDIQNAYLPYMSENEKKLGMEIINGAIWVFRLHKLPVIRIYHTDLNFGPKPGTEPFEFPKSVLIDENDPKVIKNYPSAFVKTDLDKILKEKGINTVFLCGLSSVGCVLATYHGAVERDYTSFMIKDGIMSHNSEYTDVIENICETVTFDTMRFMLEHLK
jgi:nicotinamidase-related amidase